MIKMIAPKGSAGASFNGEEYPANAKGVVEVPGEAVEDLQGHGFIVGDVEDGDDGKGDQLGQLTEAIKEAKKALKADPENAEKKAALDAAVEALKAFKKS